MKTQQMACCQGNLGVVEEPITSYVVVTSGFVWLCAAAPMTSYPLYKNFPIPVRPKTDFRSVILKTLPFHKVQSYNRIEMSSDVEIPNNRYENIADKGKSMAEIDELQRRQEAAIDIQKAYRG